MVFEWDDFGCDHIISDMCQSHDCRDQLMRLKELRPEFKATLFAIPAEMTLELAQWCMKHRDWIEVAVHGFGHISNYECSEWTYDMMATAMANLGSWGIYARIFRAPGWQISDDCFTWLKDNDWTVADQDYNTARRPEGMSAYINRDGTFFADKGTAADWTEVEAYHGHVWNVGSVGSNPNGIYEDYENVKKLVLEAEDFKFISEVMA